MDDEETSTELPTIPNRDPVLGPWPQDWMTSFLAELRGCGNIRYAAENAGTNRRTVLQWRAKFPRFRQVWDECLQDAIDKLEHTAWERAMNNTRSDQLLWNLLQSLRREKYSTRIEINHSVTLMIRKMAMQHHLEVKDIIEEVEAILDGTSELSPAELLSATEV